MATSLSKPVAPTADAAAGGRRERWRERLPAVAAALGLLLLWQGVIVVFGVPQYIAPSPLDVLGAFRSEGHLLWINFWPTLSEALLGFVATAALAKFLMRGEVIE